jgi:hypothetical protein
MGRHRDNAQLGRGVTGIALQIRKLPRRRGPVGFGHPNSSKEANLARDSVRSASDECSSDGFRPNRAMTMESPRSRTAHRKYVVAKLLLRAPRMPLQICSVAWGQGTTITDTDQLLATSISQPHLVAPDAGLTILAPLICSG